MDINELIKRGLGNTRDLAARAKGFFASQNQERQTPQYAAFRASIKPRIQQVDFTNYMPIAGRVKGGAKALRSAYDSNLNQAAMKEFWGDVFNSRVRQEAEMRRLMLEKAASAREAMLAKKEALKKQMIRKRSMEPRGGILSWF